MQDDENHKFDGEKMICASVVQPKKKVQYGSSTGGEEKEKKKGGRK